MNLNCALFGFYQLYLWKLCRLRTSIKSEHSERFNHPHIKCFSRNSRGGGGGRAEGAETSNSGHHGSNNLPHPPSPMCYTDWINGVETWQNIQNFVVNCSIYIVFLKIFEIKCKCHRDCQARHCFYGKDFQFLYQPSCVKKCSGSAPLNQFLAPPSFLVQFLKMIRTILTIFCGDLPLQPCVYI